MDKQLLVLTGCAGFIGINFLKEFIKHRNKFDKVISIDKLGYASTYNKELYNGICEINNIIQYNYNISENLTELDDVYGKYEITILDFASESHVDNSIKNPAKIFEENSVIPLRLINYFGIYNIKVYYHISTDEVYGDLPLGCTENEWFDVNSQYKPSNPYSASKVAQDAYLNSMKHTYGLNVKFIRMANQFGPYQHPEKMLPISILRAMRGEPIKVYGDGKNIRQWTFVEDTVKIINDILLNGTEDYIIHLGDKDNLYDNNFIVNKIINILKEWNVNGTIEYIKDRPGHDRMYALKIKNDIQKQYIHSFDYALRKTINYYVEEF